MTREELKNLQQWADNEIYLLISKDEKENNNKNYGAYKTGQLGFSDFLSRISFLEDNQIKITKEIFLKLMFHELLTPITEEEKSWVWFQGFDPAKDNSNPGFTIYQNTRRPSLYKRVIYGEDQNDQVKYHDEYRAVCIDIGSGEAYTGGFGLIVLDEICPIIMPYTPEKMPIKIYTEGFKAYDNPDLLWDTVGVLYFEKGGKMIEVKRFYKKVHESDDEWVEISSQEYFARRGMRSK